jgi:transcription elongation factor Elf1
MAVDIHPDDFRRFLDVTGGNTFDCVHCHHGKASVLVGPDYKSVAIFNVAAVQGGGFFETCAIVCENCGRFVEFHAPQIREWLGKNKLPGA